MGVWLSWDREVCICSDGVALWHRREENLEVEEIVAEGFSQKVIYLEVRKTTNYLRCRKIIHQSDE